MLYLTCTTITSVDLAHYGVSRAKDWISVDCGTSERYSMVCAPVRRYSSSFSEEAIDRTGAQTILYLTCTMKSSLYLAHYGISRATDRVSMDERIKFQRVNE